MYVDNGARVFVLRGYFQGYIIDMKRQVDGLDHHSPLKSGVARTVGCRQAGVMAQISN